MASRQITSKMFYINAPAGSGKTYFIKEKVNSILNQNSVARVLCITYTERATKELIKRVVAPNVHISTIHSFLNYFISPYYAHKEAIDLYFEMYHDELAQKIAANDALETDDPNNKNIQYLANKKLSLPKLTIDVIRENTNNIYYNEKNYMSLYYGGLSHDCLIEFAFKFIEKYPILLFRLKEMYQYIFIDEVQDSDAKVLQLFCNSAKDTSTEIYFFGDKMQEIYDNYDGSFESQYERFDKSMSKEFKYNYRSSEEIVNVLNNLYGKTTDNKQISKSGKTELVPKIFLCQNIEEFDSNKLKQEGFLILRIANRTRFARDNSAETMENIFNSTQKIYPHHSKIDSIDVLLPIQEEASPDLLIEFFYCFGRLVSYYNDFNYARIVQILNSTRFISLKGVKKNTFDSSMTIAMHEDKLKLREKLDAAVKKYDEAPTEYTLCNFLEYLATQDILNKEFVECVKLVENEDGEVIYSQLLNNQLNEMKRLIVYKDNQTVSTQHGVKGEGHEKVCFWSEDSKTYNPYIYLYDFFKMYSTLESFSFEDFQQFFYKFKAAVTNVENEIGMRIKDLRSPSVTNELVQALDAQLEKFSNNLYFINIFGDKAQTYCLKRKAGQMPTLKSMQAVFKPDTVQRILTAYKLFYVGCSRAKRELIVLIDSNKVSSYVEDFKNKMSAVGFEILTIENSESNLKGALESKAFETLKKLSNEHYGLPNQVLGE